MPICIPDAAGEPYRPSNGTEGMLFMEQFCDRCVKNTFDHETGIGGCDIQLATMLYEPQDAKYPAEWKHDGEGLPTCTAFELGEGS